MKEADDLESLWDSLLSRKAERVRASFGRLAPDEQQAVIDHLRRMAAEPGWHTEQRASAQAALEFLSHD